MRSWDPAEDDQEIEEFVTQLRNRLYAGKKEYGDKSFEKLWDALHQERLEEAFDVAGWSFVMWAKLKRLSGPQ
tara:strand:+ start:388 stop:606 length:219 start_codon:yes stop_codon:yes gene_type:complete